MNKQHPQALKEPESTALRSDTWGQRFWLGGRGAPTAATITTATIMIRRLSESRRQITFKTTKPSVRGFLCKKIKKTITGIQQLQIALKFPSLFLWIINESPTKLKKKKREAGISTACPRSEERYKAVIMPPNEKQSCWSQKRLKLRAGNGKVLCHTQEDKKLHTQLRAGSTTAFAWLPCRGRGLFPRYGARREEVRVSPTF